jgi:hypothetical protein
LNSRQADKERRIGRMEDRRSRIDTDDALTPALSQGAREIVG